MVVDSTILFQQHLLLPFPGGTIITITNPGLGYSGTFPVKFANPLAIGVGVGTTAIGKATADGHSIVSSTSQTQVLDIQPPNRSSQFLR